MSDTQVHPGGPGAAAASTSGPAPLTSHLAAAAPTASGGGAPPMHLGRHHVPWSPEVWRAVDHAVTQEMHRTRVVTKFLNVVRVKPNVTTVPSDVVLSSLSVAPGGKGAAPTPMLNIDETATKPMLEFWIDWSMTPPQVEEESKLHAAHQEQSGMDHASHTPGNDASHPHSKHHGYSTAVTLATRAANTLALAADMLVFQGLNALTQAPFTGGNVTLRTNPLDNGMLSAGTLSTNVLPTSAAGAPVTYSENTVAAVHTAYSLLLNSLNDGPFACALHYVPFADAYAPLPTTLILPSDRMLPLMSEGFYGTGALPGLAVPTNPIAAGLAEPQATGVFISLGGNSMDLVVGLEAITGYSQTDQFGNFIFRTIMREVYRLKLPQAVVVLNFQ